VEFNALQFDLTMIFIRFGKIIFSLILTSVIIISVSSTARPQARKAPQTQNENRRVAGQRIAPSSLLKCPRDHLTSFMGRVTNYQRTQTRISIRVRTDEETTENFTLKFTRNDDPTRLFLLRGEEFKRSDLKLIEVSTGRLRPTMRAIIWVCDDGSQPVIDWRPPEK
jgi:hypothetical protein